MTELRETDAELIKDFDDKDNLIENNVNKTKKKCIIISIIILLFVLLIIVIILIFTVFSKDETKNEEKYDDLRELDTISLEELNKARNSFKQYNFTDTENSSKILFYNLFIPDNYTTNKKYPLIVFIGDSSTVGKETTIPLTETVGGPIWATDTVQKKHKCFVLVPEYSEVIIDDTNGYSKSEYINVTIRLISKLLSEYNIDSNKIYGTGQSMGAMTTLYLLANKPDLYAAGLIVDGQWKMDELQGLKNATFTYFAAGGDEKAFNGQNNVKKFLESNNIEFGNLNDINAQEKVEILNNITKNMYNLSYQHNFITYMNGSVISPNSKSNSEHMASFKYGFRIETVRDWIFEQNKVKCPEGLFYSEDGKCSITNYCDITNNDNSCKQCIDEYNFSSDKICINGNNCLNGDKKNGICSYCKNDYYLDIQEKKCKSNLEEEKFNFCKVVDKGICNECNKFYYLDDNKKCTKSPNCSLSKDSICEKCVEGYHLSLDHICTNIDNCIYSTSIDCTECSEGYYYDHFDKICREATGNFENCRINSDFEQNLCAFCKSNYYLNQSCHLCYDNSKKGPFYKCSVVNYNGNECTSCVDGYFLGKDDHNCSKIEGCLSSLDEDTCLQCDNYYCYDNLGNCTDNYYVIDEDKKYYFRCNVLNETRTGCAECDFGLNETRNGVCFDQVHCEELENGECKRCQKENLSGYPTYCLNKEFGCVNSFDKNCIRCDDIFDLDTCTQCEEGYKIGEYGKCEKNE